MPTHVIHTHKKVVFRFQPKLRQVIVGSEFAWAEDFVEGYLHEMCHMANYQRGKQDVSSNQYHNKYFLQMALRVGFYVCRHKTQNWSITQIKRPRIYSGDDVHCPTPAASKKLRATIKKLDIDWPIIEDAQITIEETVKAHKPKECFLKYVCGCPPPYNSVRTGRRPDGPHPPNWKCEDCGKHFRYVTD